MTSDQHSSRITNSGSRLARLAPIPLFLGFIFCFLCLATRRSPYAPILGQYAYRTFNFMMIYGGLTLALGAVLFSKRVEKALHSIVSKMGTFLQLILGLSAIALLAWISGAITAMNNPAMLLISLAITLIGASVFVTWSFPSAYPLKAHLAVSVILLLLTGSEQMMEWRSDYPDYPDTYQDPVTRLYGEGGRLVPNFDEMVIGESGPVKFVTNSKGFRNDREFAYEPEPDVFRVLYIGDSFVAGYRVGQDESAGKILEDELNRLLQLRNFHWKRAEVIIASVEDPATEWSWLKDHGFKYQPNLIVMAVCLGNDPAQTFARLGPHGMFDVTDGDPPMISQRPGVPPSGLESPEVVGTCLPDFARTALANEPRTLDRVRNISRRSFWGSLLLGPKEQAILSSFGDRNFKPCLHVFDVHHALGFFLVPTMPIVETAFERTELVLRGVNADARARGVDFITVLIPQRFQISERDWELACEFYAIDPAHFDLELPNRVIGEACAENGVACLDLKGAFLKRAAESDESLFLPAGDMHWNAEGHRLAGETMAGEIVERLTELDNFSLAE